MWFVVEWGFYVGVIKGGLLRDWSFKKSCYVAKKELQWLLFVEGFIS